MSFRAAQFRILSAFALLMALLLAGCETSRLDPASLTRARFFLENTSSDNYGAQITMPISGVRIPVGSDAIVSEFDYASVDLAELELGKCLVFSLKAPAAREFYQISVGNQGKRLVLVVNGQPLGARRIDGPISDGKIYIFAETTDEKLEEIVDRLKETNFEIQKKLSR